MLSSSSNIGHSHDGAPGAGGFRPWVTKHLFGQYTVRSVEPNPDLSIRERLVRCLTRSCQWFKYRVCISLAQRIVIWLTPKSPTERAIERGQNNLARAIGDGMARLMPTRCQRMRYSTEKLAQLLEDNCKFFTEQYYHCLEETCETALCDATLKPADKIRLIAGLRKTVIAEYEKWIGNGWSRRGEFVKKLNSLRCRSSHNAANLVEKLDDCFRQLMEHVEKRYRDEIKKCQPFIGTLTDLQEEGHVSQRFIYTMEEISRKLYQRGIQNSVNNLTNIVYRVPASSMFVHMPYQFKCDTIERQGIRNIRFGNQQPMAAQTQCCEPQEAEIEQRVSDFFRYLEKITNNNQAAIYTICTHLTQIAQNNMSDMLSMTINKILGLELILNSTDIKRSMEVHPDEEDPNKIIITHGLTVCHNPGSDIEGGGPSGLLPETETLFPRHCTYLSDYSLSWRAVSFRPSMKIIVDLRNPEQAVAEPVNITAVIP